MELISNDILRKGLGISKDTPIYYLKQEVASQAGKEVFGDNLEESLETLIDFRPFDECVIIVVSHDNSMAVSHFTNDGRFRSFVYYDGKLQNRTIRENFQIQDIDIERDQNLLAMNKMSALYAIAPFSVKKNVVTLAEGRARKPGKAKKYKKQKFLYISGTYTNGVTKTLNGVRQRASYPITKVAGHPRYYRKNPETKGHDRNGNDVVGWTWVSPYKRGEGKEIEQKIRMWIK